MLCIYGEDDVWPDSSNIHLSSKAMILAECSSDEKPVFFSHCQSGRETARLAGKLGSAGFSGWIETLGPVAWRVLRLDLAAQGIKEAILRSYQPISSPSGDNELVVDLGSFGGFANYFASLPSRLRRYYRSNLKTSYSFEPGTIQDFIACFEDMKKRNNASLLLDYNNIARAIAMPGGAAFSSCRHDDELAGISLHFLDSHSSFAFFILVRSKYLPSRHLSHFLAMKSAREAFDAGLSWYNLGPASPWDGGYSFKLNLLARPRPVYTKLLSASPGRLFCHFLRQHVKRVYAAWSLRRLGQEK